MSATSKLLRAAWKLDRLNRAARHPTRYARNRAKSALMRETGLWRLWRAWWRS